MSTCGLPVSPGDVSADPCCPTLPAWQDEVSSSRRCQSLAGCRPATCCHSLSSLGAMARALSLSASPLRVPRQPAPWTLNVHPPPVHIHRGHLTVADSVSPRERCTCENPRFLVVWTPPGAITAGLARWFVPAVIQATQAGSTQMHPLRQQHVATWPL